MINPYHYLGYIVTGRGMIPQRVIRCPSAADIPLLMLLPSAFEDIRIHINYHFPNVYSF